MFSMRQIRCAAIGAVGPARRTNAVNGCRRRSSCTGMTLLELMVACSILVVLATVAMPLERAAIRRRREAELHFNLRQMRDAIDRYKDLADKNQIQVQAGTEGYPPDLETLRDGVTMAGNSDQKI